MNFYHLTHLAAALSRIPIIPPFTLKKPNADVNDALAHESVGFSTLFDMARFAQLTAVSALDWNDIRPPSGPAEDLGCWVGNIDNEQLLQRGRAMLETGLEASFFKLQASTKRTKAGEPGDALMATHSFLASFDRDESAKIGLVDQALHTQSVVTYSSLKHTKPEHQVLCMDHTLYRPMHPTTEHSTTHLDPRDHTAFHTHGKALHFTPELQETALDIVSFLLGHRSAFIAVHISAKAQMDECLLRGKSSDDESCLPRVGDYVAAVERVRALTTSGKRTREQRHHMKALSVVVSTDVTDLAFKGELASAGWTLLDYDDLELRQRFGAWLPEIMDAVVQSKATAFVGTRGSAQSTLSALRVHGWRSGPTELVYAK